MQLVVTLFTKIAYPKGTETESVQPNAEFLKRYLSWIWAH